MFSWEISHAFDSFMSMYLNVKSSFHISYFLCFQGDSVKYFMDNLDRIGDKVSLREGGVMLGLLFLLSNPSQQSPCAMLNGGIKNLEFPTHCLKYKTQIQLELSSY